MPMPILLSCNSKITSNKQISSALQKAIPVVYHFRNSQNNRNHQTTMPHTFLPQNGSYRELRVYKITEIIYDSTYYFVQHYKEKGDRTIDQMVQAARLGKQNIAEGNQAAATSSETGEQMLHARLNYREKKSE